MQKKKKFTYFNSTQGLKVLPNILVAQFKDFLWIITHYFTVKMPQTLTAVLYN